MSSSISMETLPMVLEEVLLVALLVVLLVVIFGSTRSSV